MATRTNQTHGVRVAVQGCGHGTLNAIYASVAKSCQARGWDGVDLVIIGGDFQAVRNAADLTVMSCPPKYRRLGDFHEYYSGARTAPYLTIFIGGNHEASSHLRELYYGGWVAPRIYYLGAANVLRLGSLRIAALSGIWKGFDYRKPHHERLPFSANDIRSFYHVREIDVRKLLQLRTQVDVGLSHDWPRGIEKHGDFGRLFRAKPDFRAESADGTLGSLAARYLMDRLRPPYWFSAHLHVKFSAVERYRSPGPPSPTAASSAAAAVSQEPDANPDEISLSEEEDVEADAGHATAAPEAGANPSEMAQAGDGELEGDAASTERSGENNHQQKVTTFSVAKAVETETNQVSEDIRAQLPASFRRPARDPLPKPAARPGQPVPPTISNKEVRFLALDKCLPGRHFLQLCELEPVEGKRLSLSTPEGVGPRYRLEYDPEWLAITRVFHQHLGFGDAEEPMSEDLGEDHYQPLIEAERAWVEEKVVKEGRLEVPENFEMTAPAQVAGEAEQVAEQPEEYTNPQTAAFCQLLGLDNPWEASADERRARREQGAASGEYQDGGGRRGRGWGRGRGRGRGDDGSRRWAHGRGRGRGRGRQDRRWGNA